MPSDTARENASIANSIETDWKNERGNLGGPDSSSLRVNEDTNRSIAEELTSSLPIGISSAIEKGKLYSIRYFVIKSLNHENIQLSVNRGIWATQAMNEAILDEAFHNSSKVILIFSVNMSGYFQGYAQMISSVGLRRDQVWSQGNGGRNPWGRSFEVNWLRLYDLPFQRTLHLKNPWNQYKPVKISRDCQELPPDIGEALCELLDGKDALDVDLKMYSPFLENLNSVLPFHYLKTYSLFKIELVLELWKNWSKWFLFIIVIGSSRDIFARNDFSSKRPYVEPSLHLGDQDCNASLIPNGTMFYPSLLYQHQIDASRLHVAPQRINGVFSAEESAIASGESKSRQSRHSKRNRSLANLHVDTEMGRQINMWGLPAERSPLASNLTEDDILEMTYEEYLEAYSRGSKRSPHPDHHGVHRGH